jgi:diketogulonate reductase-like aldo/keto reductase
MDESAADSAVAAMRRGFDLGLTHIDTAEMYGSGSAETLIAEAISGRRDEVFLVSKVLPGNASKRGTLAACEKSLARLRTDRLDCYLLHWRGRHPLQETIAAFETLLRDGKILAWGVSNFDVADLDDVRAIAGAGHPACNQVLYHLQERAIEHAVLPWCQRNGTAVVAYTPFGQSATAFDARRTQGRVLRDIAETHRGTARQVALAFLLRHPEVFVIPKASTLEHVTENAGAAGLALSDAETLRIEAAFARGAPRRGLPMI